MNLKRDLGKTLLESGKASIRLGTADGQNIGDYITKHPNMMPEVQKSWRA